MSEEIFESFGTYYLSLPKHKLSAPLVQDVLGEYYYTEPKTKEKVYVRLSDYPRRRSGGQTGASGALGVSRSLGKKTGASGATGARRLGTGIAKKTTAKKKRQAPQTGLSWASSQLSSLTLAQLRQIAAEVELPKRSTYKTKATLIAALRRHRKASGLNF